MSTNERAEKAPWEAKRSRFSLIFLFFFDFLFFFFFRWPISCSLDSIAALGRRRWRLVRFGEEKQFGAVRLSFVFLFLSLVRTSSSRCESRWRHAKLGNQKPGRGWPRRVTLRIWSVIRANRGSKPRITQSNVTPSGKKAVKKVSSSKLTRYNPMKPSKTR